MRMVDRRGQRYSRLTVIDAPPERRGKVLYWRCICDCGTETIVAGTNLTTGSTVSCGCFNRERIANVGRQTATTHGDSYSVEYRTWHALKKRCTQPLDSKYADYGARGITVCDRWMTYANFLADMGRRPAGTSIDRIDNDAGYSPENCRWATPYEQAQNRRPRGQGVADREARAILGVVGEQTTTKDHT